MILDAIIIINIMGNSIESVIVGEENKIVFVYLC